MATTWTQERITAELTDVVAAVGHFPARAELVARGQRTLWDAMRRSGGVEHWQARLAGGVQVPIHERIAVAAYYRHLAGGADSVSDWLAAEAELLPA